MEPKDETAKAGEETVEETAAYAADEGGEADDTVEVLEAEVLEAGPEDDGAPEDEAGAPESQDGAAGEIANLKDQILRLRAEFDNFRRRSLKEQDRIRATASEDLVREILPVADNLERAMQNAPDGDPLAQGVDMVLRMFRDVLQSRGVEAVPGAGAPFDPEYHEALAQQPSDEVPEGHVVIEYERGYRMNGYPLRHAKVVVSSGPPAPEDGDG